MKPGCCLGWEQDQTSFMCWASGQLSFGVPKFLVQASKQNDHSILKYRDAWKSLKASSSEQLSLSFPWNPHICVSQHPGVRRFISFLWPSVSLLMSGCSEKLVLLALYHQSCHLANRLPSPQTRTGPLVNRFAQVLECKSWLSINGVWCYLMGSASSTRCWLLQRLFLIAQWRVMS